MTLDALFKQVKAAGLHFSTLYQRKDLSWGCGLFGATWTESYPNGHGKTPEEAVKDALDKALAARSEKERPAK